METLEFKEKSLNLKANWNQPFFILVKINHHSSLFRVCFRNLKSGVLSKYQVANFVGGTIRSSQIVPTPMLTNPLLKISKFRNEFMKSLFLPIYERKIVRISAL